MSKDLVFNIGNIFNSDTVEGALCQYGANQFYIAPYQRGYKWASFQPNDAVSLLMRDLIDAFESQAEYYLQFITTKLSAFDGRKVLEVIDGQQRLTTLTILLSVLHYKAKQPGHPVSNHKLAYQVRDTVTDFFNNHVYAGVGSILSTEWTDFVSRNPECNEQDIYYLYHAIRKINDTLRSLDQDSNKNISAFTIYILGEVKLILNNIEGNISCEKVFSNLNDNKVELTNAELIKGLLLTKTARVQNISMSYKAITELRAIIGRQWDEVAHWANRKDIRHFFFQKENTIIEDLLLLVAVQNGYIKNKSVEDQRGLFNFFQSNIKKRIKSAADLFDDLKNIQLTLNDWFENSAIYNYIGFLLFKQSGKKITIYDLVNYLTRSKRELLQFLKSSTDDLISKDISDLEYGDDNVILHDILFALSVFDSGKKFDFVSYTKHRWSLEHIFPQNPRELPKELREKDIALINSLIGDQLTEPKKVVERIIGQAELNEEQINGILNDIKVKLTQKRCRLTDEGKQILYRLIRTDKLNAIGNMALLTSPDNSSNGNGMFDMKRYNVVRKISQGSFVPKHTYDVFSKLISSKMVPDLTIWTEQDIAAHQEYIKNRIDAVINTQI